MASIDIEASINENVTKLYKRLLELDKEIRKDEYTCHMYNMNLMQEDIGPKGLEFYENMESRLNEYIEIKKQYEKGYSIRKYLHASSLKKKHDRQKEIKTDFNVDIMFTISHKEIKINGTAPNCFKCNSTDKKCVYIPQCNDCRDIEDDKKCTCINTVYGYCIDCVKEQISDLWNEGDMLDICKLQCQICWLTFCPLDLHPVLFIDNGSDKLQELTERVQNMNLKLDNIGCNTTIIPFTDYGKQSKKRTCHACGTLGHYAIKCPHAEKKELWIAKKSEEEAEKERKAERKAERKRKSDSPHKYNKKKKIEQQESPHVSSAVINNLASLGLTANLNRK